MPSNPSYRNIIDDNPPGSSFPPDPNTPALTPTNSFRRLINRSRREMRNELLEKSQSKQTSLLKWSELEYWMQDNEFLLTSYRRASYSYIVSLQSVFQSHNETLNIWSHMVATVQFLTYLCQMWYFWSAGSTQHLGDMFAISIYRLSVVGCFGSSFLYHTFANHSKTVRCRSSELDSFGITGVIYCTGVAATYFEFYHQPAIRLAYWSLSTVFAIISAVFSLRPGFRTSAYRSVRVWSNSLLGLSCFLPILHGYFIYGYRELDHRMSVSHFISLAICQFSGGLIYGARIPERWTPETFDLIGASHQTMHVMVVIGAMIYDHGLIKAMEWWNANGAAFKSI